MEERLYTVFRPILQFLEEEGGVRSTTELDAYFTPKAQAETLSLAYETVPTGRRDLCPTVHGAAHGDSRGILHQ